MLGEIRQAALARAQAQLGVLALHRAAAEKLVSHSGGVAQQVVHRGIALHGLQFQRATLVHRHFLAGKFRQMFGHRVGQQQAALLHQHHGRHRDDGFGHGVDAKPRIVVHGFAGGRVELAHTVHERHLAVARHHGDCAGQAFVGHLTVQHGHQPLQASGAQANFFWGNKL